VDRMTPPEEHHRYRKQIGAFLLGELDGGERTAMQAHLNSCPVCRAEERELEPVVAALADADPDRIDEDPWPPGDLEESTLAPILGEIDRARRRIRRFRWSALAAAALCVVVIGLAGFTWFLEPAVSLEPLSFSGVAPGVERVEGNLIAHAWGTEIRLVASGLRDGQPYRVTLVSEDGERVSSGTFIGAGDKPVRGTFNAALLRKDAARLEVRTPGGELVFLAKLPEEPRVAHRDSPPFGILPRGILPWAGPDHQNEPSGASGPESRKGPSAEDTAPADKQEKPKTAGSGGGTTHKGSSAESDVKRSSPGGEPSASAAASPTASASASAGGTPVAPAAPPPEDQAPAESQYGGGN
jgi:hypothetical protein